MLARLAFVSRGHTMAKGASGGGDRYLIWSQLENTDSLAKSDILNATINPSDEDSRAITSY